MKNKETLLILDGNALLHRAWHAIPPLTTKEGLVVNAAYGFTMIVEKMLEKFKPEFMVVAWDLPGKTFRHKLYPEYKGQREKKEQELYDQIPLIQDLLLAYGIPSISAEGFEADDVIATISDKASEKNLLTLVVTGDMDSLQLVDETTHVVGFIKGISETKIYDIDAVKERYQLTPSQLIDYKALRGDPSDNLPGVSGIGEKTATELIHRFGTIEEIYQALEDGLIEEKFAKKLLGTKQQALDSRVLVTMVHDVKTGFRLESARVKEPDREALLQRFRELEFRTLIRKYESANVSKIVMAPPPLLKPEETIHLSRNVSDLSVTMFGGSIGVILATQQADLFGATLCAIGVSDGRNTFVISNPSKQHLKVIEEKLHQAHQVIVHDLKALMHHTGWVLPNAFDTMIASYLLLAGTRENDLSSVIFTQLKKKVADLPQTYPSEKDYQKLGQMVVLLPELEKKLRKELKENKAEHVFDEIEMPLVPVLYQMETVGIELDSQSLHEVEKQLNKRIKELEEQLITLAGRTFNVNSPLQLAEILFDELHLPTKGIKKTKTGYSTAASELEKLWDEHEIIPLISENRELTKLLSTYVEALPKLVEKDGRVHTTYNQTIAATGRLSSTDPNLQNIPVKTELGREIRKAFVAPRGRRFIAADYSQIELRIIAVLAEDQPFITAFKTGADIHTRTAAEVWEIEESAVTKQQRTAAKAINFGIMYGMGPRSLARSTGLSFEEARQFIDRYFAIHHAVKSYLDKMKETVHEQGYVETLFGRRRYLPEINSGVPMLVAQAERMALNMPIQGTQADIVKKAMIEVSGWLKQSGLPAVLLMQVHDELVLECDHDQIEPVARGLKEIMEKIVDVAIPLVVDVEVGDNWGEMETFE